MNGDLRMQLAVSVGGTDAGARGGGSLQHGLASFTGYGGAPVQGRCACCYSVGAFAFPLQRMRIGVPWNPSADRNWRSMYRR
jgi:hypothetical protein